MLSIPPSAKMLRSAICALLLIGGCCQSLATAEEPVQSPSLPSEHRSPSTSKSSTVQSSLDKSTTTTQSASLSSSPPPPPPVTASETPGAVSRLQLTPPLLIDKSIDNETNSNETTSINNGTIAEGNTTAISNATTPTPTASVDPILPKKGAAEEERHSSMAIFFVLSVLASCILLIHFILETKFRYIPESLAVVFLGAAIGLMMKISSSNVGDWKKEESLNPTMFFLILLPPIIYESGYTLHKGNFFQNIGSILVFAIIGTSISAFVIGGGVYILGLADVAYQLSFTEAFAFGSLISAVDPVATLAIFHALKLDPILNMLVFGESILNDAIAIVLATTALELNHATSEMSGADAIFNGFVRFLSNFFGSAGIGMAFALLAALLFKYIDLRKHPSLEFGMMLIFIYAPYGLAEGLHLSGIMAILFNGVVMSHYAHFNLSPVTQITMQQTLRTLAFIAETCVFAYLGLAIFSFHLKVELSLIVWSIVLCLLGRALNIYPLSYLVNYFREAEHKISPRMMFIMWFSGLRGTIAYALALHLDFEEEKRRAIITTTLFIVLFTIIILGGSTMPVLKLMNNSEAGGRIKGGRRRARARGAGITLSKTKEMGQAIETEHLSELTEEELFDARRRSENRLRGFALFDAKYLMPFFTRRFTDQEVKDCRSQMTDLTNRWYQTVRRPSDSDNEPDDFYNEEYFDDDDSIFTKYTGNQGGVGEEEGNEADEETTTDYDDGQGLFKDDERVIIKRSKRTRAASANKRGRKLNARLLLKKPTNNYASTGNSSNNCAETIDANSGSILGFYQNFTSFMPFGSLIGNRKNGLAHDGKADANGNVQRPARRATKKTAKRVEPNEAVLVNINRSGSESGEPIVGSILKPTTTLRSSS